eukprot:sb/3462084/
MGECSLPGQADDDTEPVTTLQTQDDQSGIRATIKTQDQTGLVSSEERNAILQSQSVLCTTCGETLTDLSESVIVNDKPFHRQCFVCCSCSRPFQPAEVTFLSVSGGVLCSECSVAQPELLKTPDVCVFCNKPLEKEVVLAMGGKWHPNCFVCVSCNTPLSEEYRESGGLPYCESCWCRLLAKTCHVCGLAISDQVMTIEEHHYHINCVRCGECHKTFDTVLDILNIDTDFWHVDCYRDDEESVGSDVSTTASALLGIYNKSLGFSSSSSNSPRSRKVSTVSFTAASPKTSLQHNNNDTPKTSLQHNNNNDTAARNGFDTVDLGDQNNAEQQPVDRPSDGGGIGKEREGLGGTERDWEGIRTVWDFEGQGETGKDRDRLGGTGSDWEGQEGTWKDREQLGRAGRDWEGTAQRWPLGPQERNAILQSQSVLCTTCGETLTDLSESVIVNDKPFHRHCFVCCSCSRPFQPTEVTFLSVSGGVLCSECSVAQPELLKTPDVCVFCKKPLEKEVVLAMGGKWHPNCFVCVSCNTPLSEEYRESGGLPYCESCWCRLLAKTCHVCGLAISDQVMTIEEHHYHINCVRCGECHKTFDTVLDILNIDTDFWHVDCYRDDEKSVGSDVSTTASALLGIYNKSLGFSSSSSNSPRSRKVSTVSFTAASPKTSLQSNNNDTPKTSLQHNNNNDTAARNGFDTVDLGDQNNAEQQPVDRPSDGGGIGKEREALGGTERDWEGIRTVWDFEGQGETGKDRDRLGGTGSDWEGQEGTWKDREQLGRAGRDWEGTAQRWPLGPHELSFPEAGRHTPVRSDRVGGAIQPEKQSRFDLRARWQGVTS